MSTSREDLEMPPPSRIPASAKGKGKATNQDSSSDPLGLKRKKLACEVCRVRRVRCEWRETGSCLACETGNFQCPGEPMRKKRLKKGEVRLDDSMLELEAQFKAFDIGGAMTFQFIERVFRHHPPTIVGLPTDFYKQYTRSCAGVSREREIAAEVLCGAFVAAAATFTDHAKIIGKGSPDMPTIQPAGCAFNYSAFTPYGSSRAQPVLSLTYQSRTIFEDSGMRHRPSPEAIYCLIVMDWMSCLTKEGGRGRGDRDFVEVLCRCYRTVMMGRRSEIEEKDLERLQGPINAHLLLLDAQSAAVMDVKPTFRDIDLGPLFPLVSTQASLTPRVDLNELQPDRDCRHELGTQLLPIVWATAMLFRTFLQIPPAQTDNIVLLQPIWSQIDIAHNCLYDLSFHLSLLFPMSDFKSAQFHFGLDHLVQTQRIYFAQLDLLIHQKIVQAFVLASAASTPPSPSLLDNYVKSRVRLHVAVEILAVIAKKAIDACSLDLASQVVHVLSVCSSWTSLAKEEKNDVKKELIRELGITLKFGRIFEQCLALASWSSPAAALQREGLLAALTASYGVLPSNDRPPPPTTLPPPPPPRPVSLNPRPIVPFVMKDEDFKLDLSFLDDFARENGIPIDHGLDEKASTTPSIPNRSSQRLSLPFTNVERQVDTTVAGVTDSATSSSSLPPAQQPLVTQLPSTDPFDISMFTDPIASFPPLLPFLDDSSLNVNSTDEPGRPIELRPEELEMLANFDAQMLSMNSNEID